MNDVRHFHSLFYSYKTKKEQDYFIKRHCTSGTPARKRPREDTVSNKPKAVSIVYTVRSIEGVKVPVCRQAFLGILGVKKDRVIRIMKCFQNTGKLPEDKRGGNRVKQKNFEAKKT